MLYKKIIKYSRPVFKVPLTTKTSGEDCWKFRYLAFSLFFFNDIMKRRRSLSFSRELERVNHLNILKLFS